MSHCRVIQARAQDAFQGRVELGEQAAQSVAGAGGFGGEVLVEAGQHRELGNGLVSQLQGP